MIRPYLQGDQKAILRVYRAAFAGPPWHETLSEDEVLRRWTESRAKTGFSCLVAEQDSTIVGATWWNTLTIEELRQERGDMLADFAHTPRSAPRWACPPKTIVWIRETIVIPDAQRRGVARTLKTHVLNMLRYLPKPVLVLTRMRDDNVAIVQTNTHLGFLRTGIRVPSSQRRDIAHEYWYMLIANSGEPYLLG